MPAAAFISNTKQERSGPEGFLLAGSDWSIEFVIRIDPVAALAEIRRLQNLVDACNGIFP